jgi:hypothetical protein
MNVWRGKARPSVAKQAATAIPILLNIIETSEAVKPTSSDAAVMV